MKPFLRLHTSDDPELQRIYAQNQEQLASLADGQESEFLSLLGSQGALACKLGHLNDALKLLETAVELAEQLHDAQRSLANQIRLGVTLQYLDRHQEADASFQKALKATLEPELEPYRDTVLQHWGKVLAEQGKYEAASACFEQALSLRQAKQDPELIEETEDALELLEALGEVDEKGYGILRTEISEIQVPDGILLPDGIQVPDQN